MHHVDLQLVFLQVLPTKKIEDLKKNNTREVITPTNLIAALRLYENM